MKKTFVIILALLLVSTCLLSSCHSSEPSEPLDEAALEQKYQNALELIQSGEYIEAYKLILELGNYKDAKKELAKFHFVPTETVRKFAENGEEFEVHSTENIFLNEQSLPSKWSYSWSDGGSYSMDATYDQNGNLIKVDGGDGYITEWTYDANGNCIKMVMSGGEDSPCIYEYTYDANGNILQEVNEFINKGIKNTRTIDYTYDAKGNLIKQVTTYATGGGHVYDYTYDANGNLIKQERTYDGSLECVFDYTYGAYGNLIKEEETHSDGRKYTDEYTYDANGNCIKTTHTGYDGNQEIIDYTYDEEGNIVKIAETDSYGNWEICEYTYDAFGNCIKEIRKIPSGTVVAGTPNGNYSKDMIEREYILVYVPFDYTEEEWALLITQGS